MNKLYYCKSYTLALNEQEILSDNQLYLLNFGNKSCISSTNSFRYGDSTTVLKQNNDIPLVAKSIIPSLLRSDTLFDNELALSTYCTYGIVNFALIELQCLVHCLFPYLLTIFFAVSLSSSPLSHLTQAYLITTRRLVFFYNTKSLKFQRKQCSLLPNHQVIAFLVFILLKRNFSTEL